ncbi:MAG TPA: prepilin-type N-terminal cleavage/methylation domain-containing protein [Longimicrobiaceae bacterium]
MSSRGGFTLIEVLVAMVLLGFAVLGLQAAITDRFVRDVGHEDFRATALQLAADRLTEVQSDPQYTLIPARYDGVEDSVPGFPRYRRSTDVRVANGYTVITVSVVTPTWADTVRQTVVVGAP